MPVDLVLRRTAASGPLLPVTLSTALGGDPGSLRGNVRGGTARLAVTLPLENPACAALSMTVERLGATVTGSARGRSGPLFNWCFHTLAAKLGCELFDPEAGQVVPARPETYAADARAYVETHEREVAADREHHAGDDDDDDDDVDVDGADDDDVVDERAVAFLAWLGREEHVAFVGEESPALAAAVSLDEPAALYEMLIASDEVDEVFIGESELVTLLERWRARLG